MQEVAYEATEENAAPGWGQPASDENQGNGAPAGEEGEGEPMKHKRPLMGIRPQDSFNLAGMETADADRETIRQLTEAAELTQKMREPGRNISDKSGHMERNSPLFFGTGHNPTLF